MATEDDINALPDADLTGALTDIQKTQNQDQQLQIDQKKDLTDEEALAQFKTPKDLLKGYKEVQAWGTKLAQENKELKGKLKDTDKLKEDLELMRLSQQQTTYQPTYQDQNQYQANQQEAPVSQQIATALVANTLEELATKEDGSQDPEFHERYAFAQMASRKYPQLATTPRGVKKLFEMGDKLRQESLRRNASKVVESFLGVPLTEETIQKARTMFLGEKGAQQRTDTLNAYMPDTSTSTKIGSESGQKPNMESRIQDAVNKGDVDGTIDALFKKTLAE